MVFGASWNGDFEAAHCHFNDGTGYKWFHICTPAAFLL